MMGVLAIVLLLCVAGLLRSHWECTHFEINTYTVEDARFSVNDAPVKAAVIADLHNRAYGYKNERLLAAIEELQPDVIFVAGDLPVAVPGKSISPAAELMERLAPKYPIYYGIGNHEYRLRIYPETYGTMYEAYNRRLHDAGVEMLHNVRRTVRLGNVEADVYGLEMDRRYYKRLRKTVMEPSYLQETLPQKRDGVYRILLAHSPEYFGTYAAWGADLVLSGHLHGGVMQVCGRGVISPSSGLFPKYSGGLYQKGKTRMLVSRGLGQHTIPIRLFNVPELAVLVFKGKQ